MRARSPREGPPKIRNYNLPLSVECRSISRNDTDEQRIAAPCYSDTLDLARTGNLDNGTSHGHA